MTDIIIVGAGPAGLTAAVYSLRAGKSVVLFEENTYGGQIINTPDIENYPAIKHISGFDFATELMEQAAGFGAEIIYEKVTGIEDRDDHKVVKTDSGEYESKAVIIATGAKNRPLGIDKETAMIGKGVSYCATCDGMFFKGKTVAVNGGGNTAVEDAEFLSNYCQKVYLIHRREGFRAAAADVEKLRSKSNVEFLLNETVTSIIGEDKVTGLELTNTKTGEKSVIDVDGLFIAIGQVPDNRDFLNVIDIDEKGYVIASESCKAEHPGIFVAGDCRTKEVRQLTTAAADGAIAALAAANYLNNK